MLMTQSYGSVESNQAHRESIGLNATMGSIQGIGGNYFGSQRTSLKNEAFPVNKNQLAGKQVQGMTAGNYSSIGGYESNRVNSRVDNLKDYLASSPSKNDPNYFKQTSPLRTPKTTTPLNFFTQDQLQLTRNTNINRLSIQNPIADHLNTQRLLYTSMDADIPAGLTMPKTPQSNTLVNGFSNLNERYKYKAAYAVNDSSSISDVLKWSDTTDKPKA